ncbi:MAG TPA: CPBP family intramembrane glutamic endopeptidase [Bacteroidota bacterium]|nr:CPBP family intramembrane glutamic endopeptidase [Bacteroidota bacterium]
MDSTTNIKGMGLGRSLLFFGIPSAVVIASVYYFMQEFHRIGMNDFVNFYLTLVLPLALLLVAALVAYRLEGRSFTWAGFGERFRFRRMTGKDWLYTIGLFLIGAGSYGALSFTSKWLIQFPLFAPPEFLLPAVDPRLQQKFVSDVFFGLPLKGQWWIAVVYFIALLFNIFGEEFWWRGYILPRQEIIFKKWTWLIHGLLWTLFHVFWKWNLIMLLPGCVLLSYVVYVRKNTWIGIIDHMLLNSIPLVGIIIGIIG